MKNRSPFAVFFFPLITFGIYGLYWMVKTKGEMNEKGSNIPTAWLIIIPFVNIWWMWKYSEGVGQVTNEKLSGVLAFILLWLLGSIGMAIIQDSFNKVEGAPAAASAAPTAPAATETASTESGDTTPPAATPTVSG